MNSQKSIDSKSGSSQGPLGLSHIAKSCYGSCAKSLQSFMTNSIISKKAMDFYIKKTFEPEFGPGMYNFYKETDVTKLKILIEGILDQLGHIDPDTLSYGTQTSHHTNYGKILEELKVILTNIERTKRIESNLIIEHK